MRWLFIGAGNMASSLIGGLLGGGANPEHVAVVDPDESACTRASNAFGIHSATGIESVIPSLFSEGDTSREIGVVIAVKPHIVQAVCKSVADYMQHKAADTDINIEPVFISVAAGVRESSMQAWLPAGSALIRCMPNTPALLGLGATALYANAECSDKDKSLAEELLKSAGITIWVDRESDLDAVTAVSGSGPAYFFYLIEHMVDAGVNLGLARETALTLAIETAFGAASMARQQQDPPGVLRENVTSKGGTTAAALGVFNDNNTPAIIHSALKAAHDRAIELGDDLAT
ncbi:MAG: pyrroline-5-carboxylate reductase [Granulosicoccus sp.]